MRHQAGWHKTCYFKRLQKKSVAVKVKTDIHGVHTCSSQGGIDFTESKCFLCEEPAGLHAFTMFLHMILMRMFGDVQQY